MSFDIWEVSPDTTELFPEIFSGLISNLSSHWKGRQVTLSDVLILHDAIQDKIVRFLFSQHPDSPGFEKMASRLAEIGKNPPSLANRGIDHLFVTPDGLCCRSQNGHIMQVKGKRSWWKEHKKEIIIGIVIVAVVTTVVVVAVVTSGTGTGTAGAAGSAIINEAQNCLDEADKKKKNSPRPVQNQTAGNEPPPAVPPSIPEALPSYNSPLFLEDGVISGDQYYTYWDFLQKSKQEEFFASFLNTPKPPPVAEPTPPPIPAYQPISPQPGRSFTERFFEAIGRQFLEPEMVADVTPSQQKKSHLFTTAGERQTSCQIGGINGINTSVDNAVSHADYLGKLSSGRSVDWIYNNSHGALGDLTEVFTQNYLGSSPNTASLLIDNWVAFDEKNKDNPTAKYLQFCHSQGTIQVRNALAKAPQEIRDRVMVVAIAPAAVVPDDLCFKSFNYASKRDIVPFGELVFAGALDTNEVGSSRAVEMVLEHRKQLILLDPHPDATGIDHDFQSPTFLGTIRRHLEDYHEKKGQYE